MIAIGLLYEPDSDAGRESYDCEDWRLLGISGKSISGISVRTVDVFPINSGINRLFGGIKPAYLGVKATIKVYELSFVNKRLAGFNKIHNLVVF